MDGIWDLGQNADEAARLREENLQDLRRRCEAAVGEIEKAQAYVRSRFPNDAGAVNAFKNLGEAKRCLSLVSDVNVRDYERESIQLENLIRS